MSWSNRKPYYNLGESQVAFFKKPARFLSQSTWKESMVERPYLSPEYSQMHLDLTSPTWPKIPDYPLPNLPQFPDFPPFPEFPQLPDYPQFPIFGLPDWADRSPFDFPDMPDWPVFLPFPEFPAFPQVPAYSVFGWIIRKSLVKCSTFTRDNFIECGESAEIQFSTDIMGSGALGDRFFWEFSYRSNLPGGCFFAREESSSPFSSDNQRRMDVTIETEEEVGCEGTILVQGTATWSGAAVESGINIMQTLPGGRPTLFDQTYQASGYGALSTSCFEEIEVECELCAGCVDSSIGYTTQQMAINEEQNLIVVDPETGCTYDWAIDSGGGSLSSPTGESVIYTAPSSNENCDENPIISLSVDGDVCDTLAIAINAWVGDQRASMDYAWWYSPISPYYNCGTPDCGCMYHYNDCDAAFLSRHIWWCGGDQATCAAADYHYDERTSAMITGGCCTSYLL